LPSSRRRRPPDPPLDALNLLYLLAQFRIPPYIVFGDDEFRLGLNYLALATA
jgi:hypothetical protein